MDKVINLIFDNWFFFINIHIVAYTYVAKLKLATSTLINNELEFKLKYLKLVKSSLKL